MNCIWFDSNNSVEIKKMIHQLVTIKLVSSLLALTFKVFCFLFGGTEVCADVCGSVMYRFPDVGNGAAAVEFRLVSSSSDSSSSCRRRRLTVISTFGDSHFDKEVGNILDTLFFIFPMIDYKIKTIIV